jgi:hypothetical protein
VYLKTKALLPSLNLQVPNIKNKMSKGLEEMKKRRETEKGRGRKKKRGEKESKRVMIHYYPKIQIFTTLSTSNGGPSLLFEFFFKNKLK